MDEFQDTGGMREACFQLLFRSKSFRRGMVVGDPDQCIMEFAGARANLFNDFEKIEGARSLSLTSCHRSHSGITNIASRLQTEGKGITACRHRDNSSRTLVATHSISNRQADLSDVVRAFDMFIGGGPLDASGRAILAWGRNDIERLSGTKSKNCPLASSMAQIVYDGVCSFYTGNPHAFFQAVERVLSSLVFKRATPTEIQLSDIGLTRQAWKRIVWKLARGNCIPKDGATVQVWLLQIRSGFECEVAKLAQGKVSLGPQFQAKVAGQADKDKTLSAPMSQFLNQRTASHANYLIDTIHSVKGREFDAVCLFVPKPLKEPKSAMTAWFGYLDERENQIAEPDESGAARRVTYVAVTRAKRMLMVVIPEEWYAELTSKQTGRDFLNSFDNKTQIRIGDFIQEQGAK